VVNPAHLYSVTNPKHDQHQHGISFKTWNYPWTWSCRWDKSDAREWHLSSLALSLLALDGREAAIQSLNSSQTKDVEAKRNHFLFATVLQTTSCPSQQNLHSQVPSISWRLYPAPGRYDRAKRRLSITTSCPVTSSISSCSVAYTSTRCYFGYPPTQQHWRGAASSACRTVR